MELTVAGIRAALKQMLQVKGMITAEMAAVEGWTEEHAKACSFYLKAHILDLTGAEPHAEAAIPARMAADLHWQDAVAAVKEAAVPEHIVGAVVPTTTTTVETTEVDPAVAAAAVAEAQAKAVADAETAAKAAEAQAAATAKAVEDQAAADEATAKKTADAKALADAQAATTSTDAPPASATPGGEPVVGDPSTVPDAPAKYLAA